MTTKMRIKVGSVEVEYEGTTAFSLAEFKDFLSHVETVTKSSAFQSCLDGGANQTQLDQYPKNPQPQKQNLSINTVAKKLSAKTGPDLAEAAAATIQLYEGKSSFSRNELLETMRKATMHYKDSMAGNLSKILAQLTGKKFNQISDGKYSLSAEAYEDLVKKLA